ncbi:hypothetical protein BGZ63DRAFT_408166 [Mariannaea sp. PMI_226]|nr:hypothetical protein BGZ63DRAFT_408166 [Mariannaea sp. PMI_226]
MGSISIREHIRWLPDEASEPTSTIVLTSPGLRFIDLRIFRPEGVEGAWSGQEDALPLDRLDWGIAGNSSSWHRDDGKGGQILRCQWRHWISSRTTNPESAADEGDMFPQETPGLTLEVGSMENPATGKDTPYEELWRDADPAPTTTSAARCVVLQFQSETGARGSVIRLGQYCQGIRRDGERVSVERWEFDGGWKRTIKMGDGELPCEMVLDDKLAVKVDEEVKVGSEVWKAVEVS